MGGGLHGVHVALRLLESTTDNDIVIVDLAPDLLAMWKTRTAATGMRYLRSAATFHNKEP